MTTPDASPAHEGAPVREGDILDGKYRVERVLGIGGMGVVVAARHLQLDQRVALKFVLPTAMESTEAVERFAREARAAVRLRSEHVARVLDVGTLPGGAPYMVMEYLDGRDLAEVIEQRGPLPAADAAYFVMQACEAIAEAHALGIVHRDLKPRNLFVTTRIDGQPLVKVLDFGISKATAAPGSAGDLSLTRTTSIMGSPNYMSPEQLRSSKLVDARTDVWALGIILYEALTGRVPFEAETVTQLCAMVLQDAPRPLEEQRADLPPGLSAVVMGCLEKDPARRTPSVSALARALERFGGNAAHGLAQRISSVAGDLPPRAPEPAPEPSDPSARRVAVSGGTSVAWGETQLAKSPRRRGLFWAAAAALVTLVVLGGAVFAAWRGAYGGPSAAAHPDVDAVPPVRLIELSPSPSAVVDAPPVAPAAVGSTASSTTLTAPPPSQRSPLTTPPIPGPPVAHPPPRPSGTHAPATSTVPPSPPRPHDDMPDERK
jgi:serine/threonine protein kinase